MTPKRIRSLNVSVGLMTALSLGVASLAGCASFDPNPAAKGQAPVTATSSTAPAATATTPSTAPAQPTAPAAFTNLTGTANFGGKPMANATITVVNAFTDKPISGLVAAGAGNLVAAGAGNLVAAGAGNYGLSQATQIKTDANGNYDLNIPEMGKGDIVRILVKGEDGTVLSAIAGGSLNASTYEVKQITTRKKFTIKVTVSSSLADKAMAGSLKVLGRMSPAARERAINSVVESVQHLDEIIDRTLKVSPAAAASLNQTFSSTGGIVGASFNTYQGLEKVLADAGLKETLGKTFSDVVAETTKATLRAAATGDGLQGGETVTINSSDFPSTIGINFDDIEDGTITLDDGTVVEVDVTEEIPLEAPDDTVTNSKFVPTVDLEYDTLDSNSPLKMIVSQDDNELDVEQITAKIPTSLIKAKSFSVGTVLNDKAETLVSGGWAGTGFASASNHELKLTSVSGTTYSGTWKDANGLLIANLSLSQPTGYLQLVFNFALTGNESVETVGGSVTMEALKSVLELDVAKLKIQTIDEPPVEISITSRDGMDLTATDATKGGVVKYLRTIYVKE